MADHLPGGEETSKFLRMNRVRAGLLVSSGVLAAALLTATLIWATLIWRGGDDAEVASATPAAKRPVKVVIAGTNDAKEEVTDGGIVGEGTFSASGAIRDRGTVTAYRGLSALNEGVILLRFVTEGRKGAITYMVRIDTTRRPVISRWTIASATRAYEGLQGRGTESENATFTVSTLRGRVWH